MKPLFFYALCIFIGVGVTIVGIMAFVGAYKKTLIITVSGEIIGAEIISFTLQKGKTYRVFGKVVNCEDLPMVLKTGMEEATFADVKITPVGMVRWMDESEDQVKGTVGN